MNIRRSSVGWLVALGALGCVAMGSVINPAQGYVPTPPGVACLYASQNDLAVLENSLSPAINAFVQAGTPVTFSGNSGAPVTFAIASSAALLSSPDLDSGLGTLQPGTSSYTFTSTKATATPGVLTYWDASFSDATLEGCEGLTPKTYTTAVRTFTVVSPPSTAAGAAANKKQEEEAEAKKKQEEEKAVATPATGGVSLADTGVTIQGNGTALVKLNCLGIAGCHGKLTLAAKSSVKAKGEKKARVVTIGTVRFVISGDETKTVKVDIDAAGRALLSADGGRLSAGLEIFELAPGPGNIQTKTVHLIQKAVKRKKPSVVSVGRSRRGGG